MGSMNFIQTTADAARFMEWLQLGHPHLALDTETSGVDVFARNFEVRLVQVGNSTDAWVFELAKFRALMAEVLDLHRGIWILHNASFDISALRQEGYFVPWAQVDDTMVALRVAEPTQSAALKRAASLYVGAGSALAQKDLHEAFRKNGWGWDTVPIDFPPYVRYAAMDVILTTRLYEHPVVQRGIDSPVYDLEMQVLAICSEMEQNGMTIDLPYVLEERDALREKVESIKTRVFEDHGILIGSGAQLSHWLMENGAVITKATATGKPSTDKETMAKLALTGGKVGAMAQDVLDYRKADKICGSYLDNFVELADQRQVLHPSIETLAARTGRMSIRRPALQTLPKPGESHESRLVRKAVIPRHEDHVLVSSDFEQIEMRLVAHLSGDPNLITAFAIADADPTADFFAEMGKIVYSDPGFTKKDPRRKIIKNVMYGLVYGAGADKIAITAGIPVASARDAKTAIMAAFPGLKSAMATYESVARSSGEVHTMMGRRLVVDPDLSYKGLNAVIQGSAADLFKRSLVYLAHAGFMEYMVVPVHDEVVFSIPRDLLDDARHEIAKAMLITDTKVPVPADPSDGLERWGDDA